MNADNDFIDAIASDVLLALENKRFFQFLDDQMCPSDPRSPRVLCQGTLATSITTLTSCGFDEQDIADVLAVLAARGGFCDCEVLYNVAGESRLRSEYWKAVASKRRPLHEHGGARARPLVAVNLVRLWILLEKDEVGYPASQDWEDLWAAPTSDGQFVIDSVPFFAKGIARRDQVTAVQSEEGLLAVNEVRQRSGHSTFRIWLAEDAVTSLDEAVADLERAGGGVEVALHRLLAIDADAEHEAEIWDYLQGGMQRSRWEVQVGHSPG